MKHIPGDLYHYRPPKKNRNAVHMESFRKGLDWIIYPGDVFVLLRFHETRVMDKGKTQRDYYVFYRCGDGKIVTACFPEQGYVDLIARA